MSLPYAGGVVRLALSGNWAIGAGKFTNVFHVVQAGTPTGTWAAADLAYLVNAFIPTSGTSNPLLAITPAQSAQVNWIQAQAVELTATGIPATTTLNLVGLLTGANNPLPANSAVVSSWIIARRVKGGHPRTYWAGVCNTQLANGFGPALTSAAQTAWGTAANGFLTRINALTLPSGDHPQLVCLSYYDKATVPIPPHLRTAPAVYTITSTAVHGRVDSQRKRLGREAA